MKAILYLLLSITIPITPHLEIIQKPSPNFNDRKDKKTHKIVTRPIYIILHYTSDCHKSKAYQTLSNFFRPVSAHYLIAADGTIMQLVDEAKRAWHAGKSSWHGNTQINTYSIGIEIVNPGFTLQKQDPCIENQNIWNRESGIQVLGSPNYWYPFTNSQINSLIKLCKDIMQRYSIKPEHILGHSDIAPGRKVDPGPLFPWNKLAEHNVGIWPTTISTKIKNNYSLLEIQQMLKKLGYKVPLSGKLDNQTKQVITAFQIHFRSTNIDGLLDQETIEKLVKLAKNNE